MTSSISRIDVCNMALDMVKERPLTSLDDDSDVADWFTRNYENARDALLSEHPWNFAIKIASIAASATSPAFRWDYAYPVPSDLLYIHQPQQDGAYEGTPFAHEIIGQEIHCNVSSPLAIRYVYRCETEGLWSPLFVEALAGKLAMKIGHWVSGKGSLIQLAQGIYEDALAKAKRIDGMQGTFERPYDDDVIAVRYSGAGSGDYSPRTLTISHATADDITLE